jgi:biotin synthase
VRLVSVAADQIPVDAAAIIPAAALSGEEIRRVYDLPFTTLLFRAQTVHRRFHDPERVQLSTLLSIKTGRCPEDCKYCPQSAHYATGLAAEPLLSPQLIEKEARAAVDAGASRFCMGAAWREVPDGPMFESVLASVRAVAALGVEVCCTLGMLKPHQAERLREAGCDYYNHNLDTSREHYARVITTRTYNDRLATLNTARRAGLKLCCGGILGLGESLDDRMALLLELSRLDPPPESVPINAYVPVSGVPLADQPPLDPFEFVRLIATARIVLPKSVLRLSAGRASMNEEMQALCFLAGANSIFFGDKLLTTPNPRESADLRFLEKLGLRPLTV